MFLRKLIFIMSRTGILLLLQSLRFLIGNRFCFSNGNSCVDGKDESADMVASFPKVSQLQCAVAIVYSFAAMTQKRNDFEIIFIE